MAVLVRGDGCTGTLAVYRYTGSMCANPRLGFGISWDVYRYTIPCTDLRPVRSLACHLCSFAHACEGRTLQAGTPEIATVTYARPCGIGRRSGLPSGRLIPKVGMLTTTGPLGTAEAGLPTRRTYEFWKHDNQKKSELGQLVNDDIFTSFIVDIVAFGTGGGTGSRQGSRVGSIAERACS
uniref:Uncharacterized protein n=1 Tax=Ananas comosus var. bracteatus TaxID=296719 RepID=A0A6V7PL39_ANACO|nr:unnamed protein product [Ananas comosus var. bracteatus]